jgi:hypothetical protein
VYGSDRSRWPVDTRTGAGQLVARDRAARRLLSEAEALDRVLERAPLPSLVREAALADRIVAAALRSPRIVRTEEARLSAAAIEKTETAANVIRWPGARTPPQWLRSDAGRVAGLLAACLVLGVYVGLSNAAQGTLENMAGLAFGSGSSGGTTLALLDPLDEDLL